MTLQEVLAARSEGERKLRSAVNALEAKTCADILADACTPRPPKPEWFGFGPGQWDSWWVKWKDGTSTWIYSVKVAENGFWDWKDCEGLDIWDRVDDMVLCLPVARECYPAPVGWQVLEGS